MRVLHCLWSGGTGGAERAVYQLVREQMRGTAVEPSVLVAQPRGLYWERLEELDCPTVGLGLPHGHAVSAAPRIARAMRGHDIIHFHSAEPLLMAASLGVRGVARVYTHRGGITEYSRRKRVHYAATGLLLRRSFHGLSGNTTHAARCAAGLFRIDRRRIDTTYNGLEFDLLEPTRTPEAVRAELGVSPNHFVLGTAANLKPWKRIDRLVRVAAAVDDPALRLLIVGDGAERAGLERLAGELGVAERVLFTGLQAHVADFLQVMDAFSLPSTALESFGNGAVEAMAWALPTLVFSDSEGMVEHITDGETGFVVADQAELERALRRLLADRELARRIGAAARTAVRYRYTMASCARGYEALYLSALQRASESHHGEDPNT